MNFITTYKTSLYSSCPKYITPAALLDVKIADGTEKKDAAVEINCVIQNLTTAWPRKYDALHDFHHGIPVKDVLPNGADLSKISVKRSNSAWAKILRNESESITNMGDWCCDDWKGLGENHFGRRT